jgi:hypothetical protein
MKKLPHPKINGRIEKVLHCPTKDQLADGFTKAIKLDRFDALREGLGIVCV